MIRVCKLHRLQGMNQTCDILTVLGLCYGVVRGVWYANKDVSGDRESDSLNECFDMAPEDEQWGMIYLIYLLSRLRSMFLMRRS